MLARRSLLALDYKKALLMILAAPPDRLLITALRVVLPEGDGLVVEPAAVLVEGGYIRAVWPLDVEPKSVDALAVQAGARLLDFGDRLLTPAFVNAHTHLALGALRGLSISQGYEDNVVEKFFFQLEEAMTPEDIRAFSRIGAFESLLSGVGLVWDHYYSAPSVAEALIDTGLAGVVAPTLQDLHGPGASNWAVALEQTETLASTQRNSAYGVFAALGPHATDSVSAELWAYILQLSQRHNLPIHAHLAQSLPEVQRIQQKHGCTPVVWLQRLGVFDRAAKTLFAQAIFVSKQDLSILSNGLNNLVFCPCSQLVFGFPAHTKAWTDAGVQWVVATDSAASNDSMNLQKELRFVHGQRTLDASYSAGYEHFLSSGDLSHARAAWQIRCESSQSINLASQKFEQDLLSRVMRRPGRLHPAFIVGEISVGAMANLVVWDTDHPSMWPASSPLRVLVMGDTAQAIHAMFVMGKQIGATGDFHRSLLNGFVYKEAIKEATARFDSLLKRVF